MEIEEEKVETISKLARDNMEITWDVRDLKVQLKDQHKRWQGKFWQSLTAVLLSLPQGPRAPRENIFFFFKLHFSFKIILLVYWVFMVTFTKVITVYHS
jgi:hypothetical protein